MPFSWRCNSLDRRGFRCTAPLFVSLLLLSLVGVSGALKIILLFKAATGFLFTYLLIRTRFHLEEIDVTFGGILFFMNTLTLPFQFESRYIDQFGAGLSVAAVPMLIYVTYQLGSSENPPGRQFARACEAASMGALYVLYPHVIRVPVGITFMIAWYLCEKVFRRDRIFYLIAFVAGAAVPAFPLLYSFFLDAPHSARCGTDLFVNISPRSLARYYMNRFGSRQADFGHYAFIEIEFDGHVRKMADCYVQTDQIDIEAKGFGICAMPRSAM